MLSADETQVSLTGAWRLRLRVEGPSTGPTAYAMVRFRDGRLGRYPISLNRYGNGSRSLRFSHGAVAKVFLNLEVFGKLRGAFGIVADAGVDQAGGAVAGRVGDVDAHRHVGDLARIAFRLLQRDHVGIGVRRRLDLLEQLSSDRAR